MLTDIKIKYNENIVGYIISHKNNLNRQIFCAKMCILIFFGTVLKGLLGCKDTACVETVNNQYEISKAALVISAVLYGVSPVAKSKPFDRGTASQNEKL